MSDRLPYECWPVPHFVEEELEARGTPLQSFLDVVGIAANRWATLKAGDKGLLLSECQRIAGALNVSIEFIANLNMSYARWRRHRTDPASGEGER